MTTTDYCTCSNDDDIICNDCKKCYTQEQMCDHVDDCTDGTDEKGCPCSYKGTEYGVCNLVYSVNILHYGTEYDI